MNENNPKFTVVKTPATKVTVTISRRQLWKNFVESWSDIAWEDYRGVDMFREVADVLCSEESLQTLGVNLRKLFRNGTTFMLMNDAMRELDVVGNDNLLREIIVTDNVVQNVGGGETAIEFIIVRHEDINF